MLQQVLFNIDNDGSIKIAKLTSEGIRKVNNDEAVAEPGIWEEWKSGKNLSNEIINFVKSF